MDEPKSSYDVLIEHIIANGQARARGVQRPKQTPEEEAQSRRAGEEALIKRIEARTLYTHNAAKYCISDYAFAALFDQAARCGFTNKGLPRDVKTRLPARANGLSRYLVALATQPQCRPFHLTLPEARRRLHIAKLESGQLLSSEDWNHEMAGPRKQRTLILNTDVRHFFAQLAFDHRICHINDGHGPWCAAALEAIGVGYLTPNQSPINQHPFLHEYQKPNTWKELYF